jgi:hypothetical protein
MRTAQYQMNQNLPHGVPKDLYKNKHHMGCLKIHIKMWAIFIGKNFFFNL